MNRTMLTDSFLFALHDIDVNDNWFQLVQLAKNSNVIIDSLRQTYHDRLIS